MRPGLSMIDCLATPPEVSKFSAHFFVLKAMFFAILFGLGNH